MYLNAIFNICIRVAIEIHDGTPDSIMWRIFFQNKHWKGIFINNFYLYKNW